MAVIGTPNPWDSLSKQMPRMGPPVQNMGGFGRNTAPIGQRPIGLPPMGPNKPGPAALSPSPNPSGMPMNYGPTSAGGGISAVTPGQYKPMTNLAPQPEVMTGGGGGEDPKQTVLGLPAPSSGNPQKPAPTGGFQPPGTAPAPGSSSSSSSSSSSELYGRSGGVSPGTQSTLEDQLRNYITGAMSGSVTPEFINRAKQDVFRTVQGQKKQGMGAINSDAIARGLFKSGIPAESAANLEGQSQGAISRGVADVLNNAENVNIQGRQAAAGTAGNLLGMNREWDQYTQQRSDAAAARAAANAPRTFQYIDPDTGQSYELDESWF